MRQRNQDSGRDRGGAEAGDLPHEGIAGDDPGIALAEVHRPHGEVEAGHHRVPVGQSIVTRQSGLVSTLVSIGPIQVGRVRHGLPARTADRALHQGITQLLPGIEPIPKEIGFRRLPVLAEAALRLGRGAARETLRRDERGSPEATEASWDPGRALWVSDPAPTRNRRGIAPSDRMVGGVQLAALH
jgi:hypothetical protein